MPILSASILSADMMHLAQDLKAMEDYAEWCHLDVMDGHYVPNITFGPGLVKQIRQETDHFLDTHLMIDHPEQYLDAFLDAGTDALTFHVETRHNIEFLLNKIKARNVKAGLSINPDSDLEMLRPYLEDVDLILIMSVEPGFGGQSYLPEASERMKQLVTWRKDLGLDYKISVDGGINAQTSVEALEAGADILVSGSFLFGANNRAEAAAQLRGQSCLEI